ncbi:type I polyketide synthase [Micromonospora endophytica]|uniref:Erythronolide synthase n=1 Tax=Micromonospora endophytica TaxID=515350 RepID=A0A2W2CFD2_9ACTN|nr:type I polyketide synthase [Micromonospora endophytica]PZF98071.1 erythronolide synthase [Micromonospora endophytica]RIW49473.1 SDR family NAD(P)-dependent oxidoreductase [Micromonospora endophytica]BCJ62505.1 polyketide synthase [Micromonospora endophytica]
MTGIAVIGVGCRYPDAETPGELWENVLAGRRAFRRLPDERTNLDDYWAADPAAPDRFYVRNAAVIRGYEFDRVRFKIAGSTYRSTDLTHWLALDVAAQALADAGFPDGVGLPVERTSVVVGNTLTGEFTRANVMRLRWPYVRRTLAQALRDQGWDHDRTADFLVGYEQQYKSPFPRGDEDTLAGALSNTIAGRICNHFDLRGGGFTVDAACSSSLLSVATACTALANGDVDVAIAGGVDLSIDPFELVGFARTGALARGEMRVYDRHSNGFWPGEGCGMVVLMREPEARAAGHRVYATVAGWGVSSDGRGGITRPEQDGYQLALRRAYQRAGFGVETVAMFEGHGTGTQVGDATELRALSAARRAADPTAPPAAISSIKALIGHTKAAAGVAGLIKAVLAVHHQVIPPSAGCADPHPELTGDRPALRVLPTAEPWPAAFPVHAGVTAMGFGGINTHLAVTAATPRRSTGFDPATRSLAGSAQDVEVLLVDAGGVAELRERIVELAAVVHRLSYAELADLAASLQARLRDRPYRAAVVTAAPEAAGDQLRTLLAVLDEGRTDACDLDRGVFVGHARRPARIGYLFPGQGVGRGVGGGALRRRFAVADEVYRWAGLPDAGDVTSTALAQPRIVTGTLAGLRVLAALGLPATVAVGHSLGELAGLCWAGAINEQELLRLAGVRGTVMAAHSRPGTMAGIAAGPETVGALLVGEPVVIAGYNGPTQTVVAGPVEAVLRVCDKATAAGLNWARLPVSHAFHSPLVAPAAAEFRARLAEQEFAPLSRRVISTVTGAALPPDVDLRDLLHRQITEPVRFGPAVTSAAAEVDLFVEVGPGRILSRMVREFSEVPAVAIDTDGDSLVGLLTAAAAGYVRGAAIDHRALFAGRLTRPLDLDNGLVFFANPCELPAGSPRPPSIGGTSTAPTGPAAEDLAAADRAAQVALAAGAEELAVAAGGALDLLRRLAAERAELPAETLRDDSRLLEDLHLSSITVGQLVNQAGRQMGLGATQAPTNFATATLRELAEALDELAQTASGDGTAGTVAAGVAPWVRPYRVEWEAVPGPARGAGEADGTWQVFAPTGHPLAATLGAALRTGGLGSGVLLCLPERCDPTDRELALRATQAAVRQPSGGRFVVVQPAVGATAMAKTARLEAPHLRTTVVTLALEPAAVDRVLTEVATTTGFAEISYDAQGVRRRPVLRLLPEGGPSRPLPLDPGDVLLVTGGGKGITAECALALAVETGARLAVLGRSDPAVDAELAANLTRMAEAGATVRYLRADVTDAAAVRAAVNRIRVDLGEVTGVLHGAGHNQPAALVNLDAEALRAAYTPKVEGLRSVLAAVDPAGLRLLVTFGSIIGRAGLHGEAHYATANEWLAELTAEFGRAHPGCRTLCVEWSVWSGVGMGERLSVVERLLHSGVTPIPPDQGLAMLRQLLTTADTPPVVVVAGRTEGLDTLRLDRPELPLLRFVERVLVHYPGVELVTEADLTPAKDPYLEDHRLDGNLLFPAVLGLEAMVQVAAAVRGDVGTPVLDGVEFARPIVVPQAGSTTVRVAALARDGAVEVAIRSAETDFLVDHFRATVRFRPVDDGPDDTDLSPTVLSEVTLDPERQLYGDVLFQGRRFQRLSRYRRIAARQAEADVVTGDNHAWFGMFLPQQLLLGDPGARDAFMHGIQVCVPDATLLPAGVERIEPAGPKLSVTEQVTVVARERHHEGNTYVYDLAVRDGSGTVIERWTGLRLHAVRRRAAAGPWAPPLLGPLLQRRAEELLGAEFAVAVEALDTPTPPGATAITLSRALDRQVSVRHRPDGRPEVDAVDAVSAAHFGRYTLGVAGSGTLGCDLEGVRDWSPQEWRRLLGGHAALPELISRETGEPAPVAATRVWCAVECLQKAGAPPGTGLVLRGVPAPGWVVLAAGPLHVVTLVTALDGTDTPTVAAILGRRRD